MAIPYWVVLLMAGAAGGIGVLLYAGLINLLSERPGKQSGRVERSWGEPMTFQFELTAPERPDLDQLAWNLGGRKLKPVPASGPGADLVMEGGSEFRTRLWGGYNVDAKKLPVRLEVRVEESDESSCKVHLRITDTLSGPALRDRAFEGRYAEAAAGIRDVVQRTLSGY